MAARRAGGGSGCCRSLLTAATVLGTRRRTGCWTSSSFWGLLRVGSCVYRALAAVASQAWVLSVLLCVCRCRLNMTLVWHRAACRALLECTCRMRHRHSLGGFTYTRSSSAHPLILFTPATGTHAPCGVQHSHAQTCTWYMVQLGSRRNPPNPLHLHASSRQGGRHSAHISLQCINPDPIHRTREVTVSGAMTLQAVVAEHMSAGEGDKGHQDFTGAADGAGAQRLRKVL